MTGKDLIMENGHQFLKEIIDKTYRIPKYQRGYRWTTENVTKLLEDIYEKRLYIKSDNIPPLNINNASNKFNGITFEYNNEDYIYDKPKATYCIQPLVVMTQKDCYDVIDGQQRLTTIAIIRAALKKIGGLDEDDIIPIKLSYESRQNSGEFIENLYYKPEELLKKTGNIDFEFMKQAYKTAKEYYEEKMELLASYSDEIKKLYARYLDRVLCENTQVIWYCVESNDPQKIFANFNTGKMELTNSELIKALFMDPSNYNTSNIKDKQIVISEKWDEIENKLYEPEFWAFVPHPKQYEENQENYCTRIDLIFEYLVMEIWCENSKDTSYDNYEEYRNKNISDKYIFNEIEEWMKSELSKSENKEEAIDRCWRRISKIFSGLKDLYSYDNRIYNMVGLYINLKNRNEKSVDGYITDTVTYLSVYKDLHDVLKVNRSEREDKLKELIKSIAFKKDEDVKEAIKNVRYSEGKSYEIIKMLIIYNIALLNTSKGTGERFNFLANAKNQWEREHIFASNVDEKVDDEKTRIAALEILEGDSYINYVKKLFSLTSKIEFTHDGIETDLHLEDVSSNEDSTINAFIKSNLAYEGNGPHEILARALKVRKKSIELMDYYRSIEKLEQIENVDETLKQNLIYSYIKEKDGEFHHSENIDIKFCEKMKDNIDNGEFKEDGYKIEIKKLNYTYTYKTSEKDNWKTWLDERDESYDIDESGKLNYDIVLKCISVAYKKKLKSILYNQEADNNTKKAEDIFHDQENKKIILLALKVNKATYESKIDDFFKNEFPGLLKDNSLGNMTLLTGNKKETESSSQNQKVSNKTYREKKDMVYTFFKEGQFVPIGTLLVFTDIYTKEQYISDYWLPNSRLKYLNDMIDTISSFIGEGETNE